MPYKAFSFFFFFNDTATTEIYTLSLHDALPIFDPECAVDDRQDHRHGVGRAGGIGEDTVPRRSEEHTSELQSQSNLVCRLLLEKKKKKTQRTHHYTQECSSATNAKHTQPSRSVS